MDKLPFLGSWTRQNSTESDIEREIFCVLSHKSSRRSVKSVKPTLAVLYVCIYVECMTGT